MRSCLLPQMVLLLAAFIVGWHLTLVRNGGASVSDFGLGLGRSLAFFFGRKPAVLTWMLQRTEVFKLHIRDRD